MQNLLDDRAKHVLENMYDNIHQDDTVDDESLSILVRYGFIREEVVYLNESSNKYSDYRITLAGRAYVECWREHREDIQRAENAARFSQVTAIISIVISVSALVLQIIQLLI